MKNKYPYNKPVFSYDTYIDKLIRAKKSKEDMKDMQEEAKEAMIKMSLMSAVQMKKKR